MLHEDAFDAAVVDEPEEGDEEAVGNPRRLSGGAGGAFGAVLGFAA